MPSREAQEPTGRQEARALPRLRLKAALAAGTASGLLAFAAFPPIDAGPAAFLALVPLAIVFRSGGPRAVTWAGAAFGASFFGLLISWIGLFGFAPYVALVLLQTFWIVFALAAGAWVKQGRQKWWMLLFAVAFLSGEYLRAKFPLGGFAWGGLGYSQHNNLSILRLAPYTGVWGISLVVLMVNCLMAEALVYLYKAPMRAIVSAGGAAALVLLPVLLPSHGAAGPPARIAMIQGNVPENTDDPHTDDLSVAQSHIDLTRRIKDQEPSLIVWAESSLDHDPFRDPALGEPLGEIIEDTGAPFIVGANLDLEAVEGQPRRLRNTSLFFGPGGRLSGVYSKQKLVPFGEQVPLRAQLQPIFKEIGRVPFDTVPGKISKVFSIKEGRFASLICYESTYPGLVRSFVVKGARLLVVSTNNSSFERSAASRQHVAFSQLRAAEHRMWVAHTALSGISAVVDPHGRVLAQTQLFEPAILLPTIRFATETTLYARMGDWVPWSSMAVMIVFAAMQTGRRLAVSEGKSSSETDAASGTLVVIPTYNEAGNIDKLLDKVFKSDPGLAVLVIDDSSPDGTGDLLDARAAVDPRVQVIHRPSKQGLGKAYVDGFTWGMAQGYELFVEMDADLSHDPADVPRLVEATSRGDLIIGSRYTIGGSASGWSKIRHLLSRAGNVFASMMLGLPVKDSTSGLRCYKREVLEAVHLASIESEGYAFQIEMAYRTFRNGYRIIEIPIVFRDRTGGVSKMSKSIVLEAIVSITKWTIRDRIGNRKRGRVG